VDYRVEPEEAWKTGRAEQMAHALPVVLRCGSGEGQRAIRVSRCRGDVLVGPAGAADAREEAVMTRPGAVREVELNEDETIPATASEVAAALKDGDIDALVELAKTLQEKTGDREFVESMLVLIFELLPMSARAQILADGAKASENIVDLFTRKPREE
jgi:hypothetical protein